MSCFESLGYNDFEIHCKLDVIEVGQSPVTFHSLNVCKDLKIIFRQQTSSNHVTLQIVPRNQHNLWALSVGMKDAIAIVHGLPSQFRFVENQYLSSQVWWE